jgi:hypothetical protein
MPAVTGVPDGSSGCRFREPIRDDIAGMLPGRREVSAGLAAEGVSTLLPDLELWHALVM